MHRFYMILILILFMGLNVSSQVFDIVVDDDGEGDFTSINDALASVSNNASERTLIFVKSGVYNEKIWLTANKQKVSLIGENVESVIIDWDDYQGKVVDGNTISGADSYTFLAEGEDLYMENMTIINSAGKVGQAPAIRTIGDRSAFKNCRFLGNQDTYYAHKRRQYNYKCTIEGNTDYIYGDATSVFDSCEIRSVPGGSYITAPADAKLITSFTSGNFYHGLLFRYCEVTSADGVSENSVYLGRPWQPRSSSVFIECVLGDHIKPQGWSTWSDDNHLSSYFAEYKNKTPEGNLVDVSQRVSWSYQLEDALLNRYALKFFLHDNGNISEYWNPVPMVTPLYDPQNPALSENQLSWDEVAGAVGYVIYKNNVLEGFSATNTFELNEGDNQLEQFRIVSVSDHGALSDGTVDVNTAINSVTEKDLQVEFNNNVLVLKEPADVDVFGVNGKKIVSEKEVSQLSLRDKPTGMYIVVVENKKGLRKSFKVLNQ